MSALTDLYRGETHYDFTRLWKWGVRISTVLFVVSLLSLGIRGLNLGIDFEGGISWEVQAPSVTIEQARDLLRPYGLADAKVQTIGGDLLRVQAAADSVQVQNEVRDTLAQAAGVPSTDVAISNVGPTWGGEVTASAVRALVLFLIGILGYVTLTFRGEWKMALGVVVAVVHDVVISVGVYSIFQFEVTPATVIAFLTILGYSIYDTVVVYDKVQENSGRVGVAARMSYSAMMNLSMNQVLARSINTSVLAVLPVLSTLIVGAYILGAITLQEFAVALTVGLAIGAYSSIFIAAPVVAWMKEREPRNRQLRERLARTGGDARPATDEPVPAAATAGATAVRTRPAPSTGERRPTSGGTAGGRADDAVRAIPPRPRKKGKRR